MACLDLVLPSCKQLFLKDLIWQIWEKYMLLPKTPSDLGTRLELTLGGA